MKGREKEMTLWKFKHPNKKQDPSDEIRSSEVIKPLEPIPHPFESRTKCEETDMSHESPESTGTSSELVLEEAEELVIPEETVSPERISAITQAGILSTILQRIKVASNDEDHTVIDALCDVGLDTIEKFKR